ncbi:hypothetical protein PUN28_007054 [Cardiocondyla obscurior]|uniref:BTB domain-containing protein n=1 Tax=Cardiocondyla obscurior TaxID=286306 RepID=A0AAW2G630_9HYME
MLQQRGRTAPATTPATAAGSASSSSSSSSTTMFPQQYCLRWKYHHSNLQTMFSQLLERQAYCDVTLACEGKTLRAHKVVLSACSTYFDTILSQYEEKDPIVIMRDVKFSDIKVLVEFMYKGEINIDHVSVTTFYKRFPVAPDFLFSEQFAGQIFFEEKFRKRRYFSKYL